MTSSTQEVIDKILTEHKLLGTSRFMGQIDLGGMPTHLVNDVFADGHSPVDRTPLRHQRPLDRAGHLTCGSVI
ncbi:hypothetical protein [Streptomyces gardneri]